MAIEERKRIQRREHMFKTNAHLCFRTPQRRGMSQCNGLRIDGVLVTDRDELLQHWNTHFTNLSQSRFYAEPELMSLKQQLPSLISSSFEKEEHFLDVPFTQEEVDFAIQKLKLNKPSGPDDLTAEHLRYGEHSISLWLTEIFNSELEHIPPSLKFGITIPVYKGSGKDPLDANSYRGITKVLELLGLERLNPMFKESSFPQSAYKECPVQMLCFQLKKLSIATSRRIVKSV